MAAIEKELNFAAVAGKTREDRHIVIWPADIRQIIPESVKSTVTRVDGAVPSYRVNCSRPDANGKIEQIGLDIRILASAAEAHRLLLRHFLHVSAPLALLQKQWAKEQVPYGDVHFGLELWATGNVAVHLTDGGEHKQLVRDVFMGVDRALTSLPDPGKEPLVGVTVRTAPVRDPVGWEITVEKFPLKTQPALSVRGFDAQLVGKGKVLITPRAGAGKSDVRLVVLRQGEKPEAVRIPIGAQANPASGTPNPVVKSRLDVK